MKTLFLVWLCLASSLFSYASTYDTLHVKVRDEKDQPVKGIKVIVHDYPAFSSDAKGHYDLKIKEALEMPFEVLIESAAYDIVKFSYYKDAKELLVKVKRKANSALPSLAGSTTTKSIPSADAHARTPVLSRHTKEAALHEAAIATAKKDVAAQLSIDSARVSNTYNQYKGDFERITHDIYLERQRLILNNNKIKEEISSITQRLDKEKNLTKEERLRLKAYLKKLEREFEQNAIAFKKAEEQTKELIDKLKMMLLEKDSINLITATKLKIEQEKRMVAERKNTRSFTVFSIITLCLLFLAVSSYLIARKMRKQRSNLLLSNHELNEQKKLIEEQNKQLDIFAYRASHDIKGPLKAITALSSLAPHTVKDKDALELFGLIHNSSVKLDNLVTEMLLLAKDAKSELTLSAVNAHDVVQEILKELNSIEGYTTIHIQSNVPPSLVLTTDRTLFHSIVQNLIENAIKYSDQRKEQKTLTIASQETGNFIDFSFTDNGVGIAAEFHEKVFSSFFRNSHDSNGTGLGLYIVKQNILKLGGSISLESTPGKGSTFTVHLPVC
ncbi:MAG: hypothetical protein JWO58_2124 [Chitinophagaceae bacterium]|nr:hypothetical protein [Chitinophagaceae bacterium]